MRKRKQYPIQISLELKAALDVYRKKNGLKSYGAAVSKLLGMDTPFYKQRCWEELPFH